MMVLDRMRKAEKAASVSRGLQIGPEEKPRIMWFECFSGLEI